METPSPSTPVSSNGSTSTPSQQGESPLSLLISKHTESGSWPTPKPDREWKHSLTIHWTSVDNHDNYEKEVAGIKKVLEAAFGTSGEGDDHFQYSPRASIPGMPLKK